MDLAGRSSNGDSLNLTTVPEALPVLPSLSDDDEL
jgi:hypothetical protein